MMTANEKLIIAGIVIIGFVYFILFSRPWTFDGLPNTSDDCLFNDIIKRIKQWRKR